MSEGAQVFAPVRGKLGTEVVYSLVGLAVVGPAMVWWNDIPWTWSVGVGLPLSLALILGRDVWSIRIRGRDLVEIAQEGIRVSNRRRAWQLSWHAIARVYRFKETIVFETGPPQRRETLLLEGHEEHLKEMVAAISARARTSNLGWVDTLAGLLG